MATGSRPLTALTAIVARDRRNTEHHRVRPSPLTQAVVEDTPDLVDTSDEGSRGDAVVVAKVVGVSKISLVQNHIPGSRR